MQITSKLVELRALMKKKNIAAYIIPSADPHQSEYVAPRWKSRAWISGFTGSAGTVVVTAKKAGLWTDGRYFLQAENQLAGSTITLFKAGLPETPSYTDWIGGELKKGEVVSFDASVMSINDVDDLKKTFEPKGIKVASSEDLIDKIWKDRPAFPSGKAFLHPVKYAGLGRKEKFENIRNEMEKKGVDYHLFASLDDLAWIFNIRGNDVECNPVVMGFGVIGKKTADLFVKEGKFSKKDADAIAKDGVTIHKYEEIYSFIKGLKGKIFIDKARTSQSLLDAVDCKKAEVVNGENMSQIMKGIKNATEIEGMKKAHIIDGVAMVKFLCWLDKNIGKTKITEISASDKLEAFRKEGEGFVGLSFDTISGYGAHGAIIHYSATPETDCELKPEGLYLVDSGAQYYFGTTDITRTVAMGKLTKNMKRDFTLVLKGHIRIAISQFPQGFTTGANIDAFAREALWKDGKNYLHGTGHGVGAYLSVHEGPMSISTRRSDTKIEPGMVVSNEPGYYEPNQYGIRIENLVLSVPKEKTAWGQFVGFENLTMCPIDIRAIEPSLLSDEEKKYLNDYHKLVFKTLSPMLGKEEKAWLKKMTAAI
ncbi:aminopeptidase P family protein [bacterium]|nr:aminopeptidase P family protein [bacterium]MBP5592393.1 aminopeptidase P family protein [bacterium]